MIRSSARRSSIRALACLAMFAGLPACSNDRHSFVSTEFLPTTVSVEQTSSHQVLWKMDIPVSYRLVLDMARRGEVELFKVNGEKSATHFRWKLYTGNGWLAKDSGRVTLPPTASIIRVSYRPAPEYPPGYAPPGSVRVVGAESAPAAAESTATPIDPEPLPAAPMEEPAAYDMAPPMVEPEEPVPAEEEMPAPIEPADPAPFDAVPTEPILIEPPVIEAPPLVEPAPEIELPPEPEPELIPEPAPAPAPVEPEPETTSPPVLFEAPADLLPPVPASPESGSPEVEFLDCE